MTVPSASSSGMNGQRLRKRHRNVSSSSWSRSPSWAKAAAFLCSVYVVVSGYSFFALHAFLGENADVTTNGGTNVNINPSPLIRGTDGVDGVNDVAVNPGSDNNRAMSREDQSAPLLHPDDQSTPLLQPEDRPEPPEYPLKIKSGPFKFDKEPAEAALKRYGARAIHKPLAAYVEPIWKDTVPGTGERGDMESKHDDGVRPAFVVPLPLRKHTPSDLRRYEYHRLQTCHDMPGKFPTDRGLEHDEKGHVIVWNVGDTPTPPAYPAQEAPYCPVEADPFLPWIHDVFPNQDGTKIKFIAQNRRRCRTGSKYDENVNRLVPQVALMQSVSVQRIDESRAQSLAPELWHPPADTTDTSTSTSSSSAQTQTPRYRLAPYNEAATDGMFTRFICRFHATDLTEGLPQTILLGETLSEFPFNYEMVSYRKGQRTMLTPKGKDSRFFWTSNLRFDCPVPSDEGLRRQLATGNTILSDGTPTVYVDLIPIRTSVRYDELYLTEDMIGPKKAWGMDEFNATERWGERNVLPRIEASGRWENIPICLPPSLPENALSAAEIPPSQPATETETKKTTKPHYLSACLWASAEFKTRGIKKGDGATTDTQERLAEWIEFHLMTGFDHIYVYDNSGAHTNETSLEPILSRYPGQVTRIDWPSIVCNNNIPAADSTGERSSQYAAENSCRTRYAPFTEWIAAFDTDEYFVPMGNYTSTKDVLRHAADQGTNILSFRSSRGKLRHDKSDAIGGSREQSPNTTFLEAYNCDSAGSPKPQWADRARKQIYRADYVLYHYVHYSTVTQGHLKTYNETAVGEWKHRYGENSPSERVVNELTEAVMIHTKTLKRDMTGGYEQKCRFDWGRKWMGCMVAYPWPNNEPRKKDAHNADGMEYNCFINENVDNYWIPRLRDALEQRQLTVSSQV